MGSDTTSALELASLEARLAAFGPEGLLGSLRALASELASSGPVEPWPGVLVDAALVTLVARVVACERVTLGRDRDALFSVLWNRLHWHDSPEAAAFFTGGSPWASERPRAYRLAAHWRRTRESAHPDAPWLESLRPLPGRLETLGEHVATVGGPIHCLAVSPDGRFLGVGLDEGVASWELARALPHETRAAEGPVFSIAWDATGSRLAGGTRLNAVLVWGGDRSELLWSAENQEGQVTNVAWSPDGSLLAAANLGWVTRLFTRDGAEVRTLEGHEQSVLAAAWHPDGKLLATGASDDTVRVWDVASGRCERVIAVEAVPRCLAWSPDGTLLAAPSGHGSALSVWRATDGALVRAWPANAQGISWLGPARLFVHAWDEVRVHELGSDEPLLRVPCAPPFFAVPLPAEDRLALATDKGEVEVRDLAAPAAVPVESEPPVKGLWVDRAGERAVLASGDEHAPGWRPLELRSGLEPAPAVAPAARWEARIEARREGSGSRVSVDAGRGRIASVWNDDGDEGATGVLELATGEVRSWPFPRVPEPFRYDPPWLRWHPDGRHLVVVTADRVVRIYDATSGACVVEHALVPRSLELQPTIHHVHLSRRGDRLLVGFRAPPWGDAPLVLWSLAPPAGAILEERAGGLLRPVFALAEGFLAVGSPVRRRGARDDDPAAPPAKSSVRVWDLATRALVGTVTLEGAVDGVALAPDGSAVAAAGRAGVRVWRLPGSELAHELEAPVGLDRLALRPGWLAGSSSVRSGLVVWDLATGGTRHVVPGTADPAEALDDPLWLSVEPGATSVRRGPMGQLVVRVPYALEGQVLPGARLVGRGRGDHSGAAFLFQVHGGDLPELAPRPPVEPLPLDRSPTGSAPRPVPPRPTPEQTPTAKPKGFNRW